MNGVRAMLVDAAILGYIAAFGTLAALYAKDPSLPTNAELYGAVLAFGAAFFGALAMMRRVVSTVMAQAARRKVS